MDAVVRRALFARGHAGYRDEPQAGSLDATLIPVLRGDTSHRRNRIVGEVNDPTLQLSLRPAIEQAMGAGNLLVSSTLPTPFSEDFGWFTDEIPGVMYWLGVANAERGWSGVPHSPDYVADEDSIQTGARAMAAVILNRLQAGSAATTRSR